MLRLPDHWVWDFWFADDGDRHHVFFLHAPRSLGDEHRRHRAARIGHAVSDDLVDWAILDGPFGPGPDDAFDGTTTWTGSVVRGQDDRWRMFYTGTRFLEDEPVHTNIETVGVAVSDDLVTWQKLPGPVTRSDPRWYETLGNDPDVDGALFPEEAWRDPWVHEDPSGGLWHMLVTARSTEGALDDRGVIGHATSTDLERWEVQPPLTSPGSGFVHLEVPQVVQVDGAWFLVFSCPADALSTANPRADETPGTWSVPIDGPFGPFDVTDAEPLTDVTCYSGRIVRRRDGSPVLMTFANGRAGEPLPGFLHDPVDVHVIDGRLALRPATPTAQTQTQTQTQPCPAGSGTAAP
ncbi:MULTISPECIES: glycosyl hydrolase family 32 [Curtobacterium]|uniref:beta-fructofuranosidase n=2 Tax=Curtobacterium TaxID=2034 RepID=A0A5P8YVH1_9MICO|nr:glycosyl hydrolase family 32 [Curtobacterium flaccumfaciens]MBO9041506.1 glycosyl hydrolase family 32 [Curtobacterium flaccumfaciens pv. flaccumfaciens]MBO9044992.1 glycosyl hydrolase family 32 [Curtobacterium flaccumfaciens pv. flaccumfaciens]MBO9048866.1 glycosyl hydrolase family 32 [Curtobacterium flaccumfaciens pv. flaccumfaciens]MBO9057716.1 glycosyl hydrolase family 32 [Curtobacterium flaccumfaciens pv. flaccumfaciens]MBT1543057.1 glycosyl hydrolase family 32 [Curtobacterium flaccumfa